MEKPRRSSSGSRTPWMCSPIRLMSDEADSSRCDPHLSVGWVWEGGGEGGISSAQSAPPKGWGRPAWWAPVWRCSHRGKASSSPGWKRCWWSWWNWSWSWACLSSSCPSARPPQAAGHRSRCQCHEPPGNNRGRVTAAAETMDAAAGGELSFPTISAQHKHTIQKKITIRNAEEVKGKDSFILVSWYIWSNSKLFNETTLLCMPIRYNLKQQSLLHRCFSITAFNVACRGFFYVSTRRCKRKDSVRRFLKKNKPGYRKKAYWKKEIMGKMSIYCKNPPQKISKQTTWSAQMETSAIRIE